LPGVCPATLESNFEVFAVGSSTNVRFPLRKIALVGREVSTLMSPLPNVQPLDI
jgi:hypothetical protein